MLVPLCDFLWLLYIPFNVPFLIVSIFNMEAPTVIVGFVANLISCVVNWAAFKFIVPMLYYLPIAGQILVVIQPVVKTLLKVWIIVLLIAGPIMIFLCQA